MEEIDYTTGFWLEEPEDGELMFDGDIYEFKLLSQCCFCLHNANYVGFAPTCNLYPKGIPPDIWLARESCEKYADSKIQTI